LICIYSVGKLVRYCKRKKSFASLLLNLIMVIGVEMVEQSIEQRRRCSLHKH